MARLLALPLLVLTALPATAAADSPTGDGSINTAPLRLVFFDGSKLRGSEPATPQEKAVLDRLAHLSALVTLTEEPPARAAPLFDAGRYDCLVDLRFDTSPPRPGTLSSREQMQIDYLYYQRRDTPPPDGAVRVARHRTMADWPASLNGIPYAELIGTNDVVQTVALLKGRRVDYILVYPGNMPAIPEVQRGEIVPVPGLPPARTAHLVITCHASDRARVFLDRLDALTPAPPVSPVTAISQ